MLESLGDTLDNATDPNHPDFDPEFNKEIRNLSPRLVRGRKLERRAMSKDQIREDILYKNCDDRIILTGRIDRHSEIDVRECAARRPCSKTCIIWRKTRKQTDLGHLWVQDAFALREYARPSRIRCSVHVKQFKAYDDISKTYFWKYTVAYPRAIACVLASKRGDHAG